MADPKALEKGLKYIQPQSRICPPDTHAVLLGFGGLSEKASQTASKAEDCMV
ncbi:hypothetical protein PO124_25205 [Bacillus licheniformis]|nr:hypothetical protein [Bacillus licheniformis]